LNGTTTVAVFLGKVILNRYQSSWPSSVILLQTSSWSVSYIFCSQTWYLWQCKRQETWGWKGMYTGTQRWVSPSFWCSYN